MQTMSHASLSVRLRDQRSHFQHTGQDEQEEVSADAAPKKSEGHDADLESGSWHPERPPLANPYVETLHDLLTARKPHALLKQ